MSSGQILTDPTASPPTSQKPPEPPPPPITVGPTTRDPYTAALNHLADAINQLAQAIVATYRPPTTDTQAEGGSPGPAKGLTTPHRWFGPVTAEGGEQ